MKTDDQKIKNEIKGSLSYLLHFIDNEEVSMINKRLQKCIELTGIEDQFHPPSDEEIEKEAAKRFPIVEEKRAPNGELCQFDYNKQERDSFIENCQWAKRLTEAHMVDFAKDLRMKLGLFYAYSENDCKEWVAEWMRKQLGQ